MLNDKNVACVGEMRNIYITLVQKREWKKPHKKALLRNTDAIEMDFKM
jgi:hypothetical protein